ncbi:hypothetical protein OMAG_000604 [Candidatus Omnitrophus magneticus]|uniref:Uncharacterized protein n=1 Tax=Candidatus Omnitrophus magneticus TaxID=1609969 RepID=A0A0F0CVR3_9BACT|nr:hypothetical protein OMAG_000604 [Candidatus Omnitrophus magneticus]
MAKNESFEKTIACQSVGAVNACAGSFSSGKQSFYACSCVNVSGNAAHKEVCCRSYWNWLACYVNIVFKTGFVDARESSFYKFSIEMGNV